jgi:hypothetical protein
LKPKLLRIWGNKVFREHNWKFHKSRDYVPIKSKTENKQFPIFITNVNENYEGITTMYGYADMGEITECINCSNKVWIDNWRNEEGYPCDLCGLPNNMNMEDLNKMKLAYKKSEDKL